MMRSKGTGAATRRQVLRMTGSAVGAVALPAIARGQAWPARVIKFIVPFTPGGSTDVLARKIGHRLEPILGQPIVIENKPGAGGVTAAATLAKAERDGYTFMMGHIGTLAFNPWLYPGLPYDPKAAFAAIALVATIPNVLAVHPSLGVVSVAELVASAKRKPGEITYGTGGVGSAAHVATAYFAHMAGIELLHVPYRGTSPAVNDLTGGHIKMMLTGGPALLPLVAAGQIRALAVSSGQRAPFAPDLPTLAEAAGLAGFEAVQWYGLVAPAGLPANIVDRMNGLVNEALASPEIVEALLKDGAIAAPGTPQSFQRLIEAEIDAWGQVIARANIKAG